MNKRNNATLFLVLFAMVGLLATPVFASFIGTAYNDGVNPAWQGSTPFEDGDLKGTVEWIVYGPGDFPSEYTGFTPTAGQFTYAYRVFNTGSDNITSYEVYLSNVAGIYGAFSGDGITGVSPISMIMNPLNSMVWNFGVNPPPPPPIGTGESSIGLAYCSPNTPQDYESYVNDGGNTAYATVPSPSSNPIPEPATIWLLIMALGFASIPQLRRR